MRRKNKSHYAAFVLPRCKCTGQKGRKCCNRCSRKQIKSQCDSVVWCSAFVLGVDVWATREDDAVIGVVGKISHSIVQCSAFAQDLRSRFTCHKGI